MKTEDINRILALIEPSKISVRIYGDQEVVFHEGNDAKSVFFVELGEICALRYLASGKTLVLHRISAGNLLGETCLRSPRRNYTAVASGPSRVTRIGLEAFTEALDTDVAYWKAVYGCVADHLIEGYEIRKFLAIRKAEDRLLSWLSWKDAASPNGINLENSLGNIGLELNLTRESIYRAFASLKKRGFVNVREGVVRLTPGHR